MRVNAVISGQAGVALLVDGQDVASIHAGRPGEVVRRSRAEARFLLGDAQDLQFLEDVGLEEIGRRLELASAQVDALHIALILLSRSAADDTRRDAAEELEEFLADDEVADFLERIFFSHPLPRGADLPGAHSSCTGRTDRTRSFLWSLGYHQASITAVYFAWEGIPTEVFGTEENQAAARAVAIRGGLFRDVVRLREKNGSVLPEHLARPEWDAVPRGEVILSYWLSALASQDFERGVEEAQPELSAQPLGLVSEVREGGATPQENAEPDARDLLTEEQLRRVHAALEELPPRMRRVMLLHLEGHLYSEIAAMMEISIETVYVELSRARNRLKETLGEPFDQKLFK